MVTRALNGDDFDAVYVAFSEAFSDYVVPLTLTKEQLREMLTRRGWTPSASVGVFEDERIVAFTLNAVENDRAYDTGTGVVSSHRRRGLARETLQVSYELLRQHGAREYVLEVLEQNTSAAAMYLDEGFAITRGLQSWKYCHPERSEGPSVAQPGSFGICAPQDDTYFDVAHSWQNSSASIARAQDLHMTLGNDDGFAILFPNTGDIPQLAVRKDARRKGTGMRLLRAAAAASSAPMLRLMNIDESARGIAAFLEHAGAQRFVRQLEMVKSL